MQGKTKKKIPNEIYELWLIEYVSSTESVYLI